MTVFRLEPTQMEYPQKTGANRSLALFCHVFPRKVHQAMGSFCYFPKSHAGFCFIDRVAKSRAELWGRAVHRQFILGLYKVS